MSQLEPLQTIKHNQRYTVYGYCHRFAVSKYDIPIAIIEIILAFYKLMKIINNINKTSTFGIIQYTLTDKTNFFSFNFTDLNFKHQIAICIVEDIKDFANLSKSIDNKKFNGCLFTKIGSNLHQNDRYIPNDFVIRSNDSIKITNCVQSINEEEIKQTINMFIYKEHIESVITISQNITFFVHKSYYLCVVLFDRNDSICYENMTFGDSEHTLEDIGIGITLQLI